MTEKMMDSASFQKLYFIINIAFNILKNILLSLAMTMKLHTVTPQKNVIPDLDDELFIHKQINSRD